jgi:hypothetical protein
MPNPTVGRGGSAQSRPGYDASTGASVSAEPSAATHRDGCRYLWAATCAVGIECEHGYDACPICDPCDCAKPFQARVELWMRECFGDVIPFDKEERVDRLLEEVFEILQSGGYDPARVLALRDYVWNRPAGEPAQEAGGVMVTMAAYCRAFDLDMHAAGETELARIWTKVDVIRAKQAAKPTGSALPVALRAAPASPAISPSHRLDEPSQTEGA